jgi:hypothetical protein
MLFGKRVKISLSARKLCAFLSPFARQAYAAVCRDAQPPPLLSFGVEKKTMHQKKTANRINLNAIFVPKS